MIHSIYTLNGPAFLSCIRGRVNYPPSSGTAFRERICQCHNQRRTINATRKERTRRADHPLKLRECRSGGSRGGQCRTRRRDNHLDRKSKMVACLPVEAPRPAHMNDASFFVRILPSTNRPAPCVRRAPWPRAACQMLPARAIRLEAIQKEALDVTIFPSSG